MKFYKSFIPLRDKIEAGADLVRTITSFILLFYVVRGRQEAKEELKVLRAISLSLVL